MDAARSTMRRARVFTPHVIAEITTMRLNGSTTSQIAEATGIPEGSIKVKLSRLGVRTRNRRPALGLHRSFIGTTVDGVVAARFFLEADKRGKPFALFMRELFEAIAGTPERNWDDNIFNAIIDSRK